MFTAWLTNLSCRWNQEARSGRTQGFQLEGLPLATVMLPKRNDPSLYVLVPMGSAIHGFQAAFPRVGQSRQASWRRWTFLLVIGEQRLIPCAGSGPRGWSIHSCHGVCCKPSTVSFMMYFYLKRINPPVPISERHSPSLLWQHL